MVDGKQRHGRWRSYIKLILEQLGWRSLEEREDIIFDK